MEGGTFLNLIESIDRFAVGIFRQFLIKEEDGRVLILTPNEEYKRWAIAYINTKLKGFGKSIVVECQKEEKPSAMPKDNLLEKYNFENFVVDPANELAYKVCVEVSIHIRQVWLGKDPPSALHRQDVQFLVGKERTQIELFRIYERLQAEEKQIVLVSDRHPKDLKDVSERLVSRFESGLIIEIGLDEETKRRIVKQKLILYGLPLDEITIDYVMENTGYNIREIEGFIKTFKIVGPKPPTNSHQGDKQKKVETIINLVARSFKLSPEPLKRESKERKVINAKHIAMYFCKTLLNLSYSEISNIFGKKDHTSAIYAIKKVEQRRTEDRKFQYMLSFLEKSIKRSIGL